MEQAQDQQVKKENVWSGIVEPDSDDKDEYSEEEESQVCEATKTDGKPCQGIKYKDTQYCYNHLMALQTRPRGRPKKVVDKVVDKVVEKVVDKVVEKVAPVAPIIMDHAPSPRIPATSATCSLVEKLSQRLKEKVEGLDDEMKTLLKLLL
jgi:hypothetical protein